MAGGAPGARSVRLRRAAVVNFLTLSIRNLFTLLYAVVVARALGVNDYAALGVTVSIAFALTAPTIVWVYWAQRAAARGVPGALETWTLLTAAYTAAALAAVAFTAALVAGDLVGPWEAAAGAALFTASTAAYIHATNMAVAAAPGLIGPVAAAESGLRLALASALALAGALDYSTAVAVHAAGQALGATALAAAALRGSVRGRPSLSLARAWLRLYRVPLARGVEVAVSRAHRGILAAVGPGGLAVAYANIAYSIVMSSVQALSGISAPLYARLLAGAGSPARQALETLRLAILAGGALVALAAALARPIASLYNPAYQHAWPLVPLAALAALVAGVAGALERAATGTSREDETHDPSRVERSPLGILARARLAATTAATAAATALAAATRDPLAAAASFTAALLAANAAAAFAAYKLLPHRQLPKREAAAAAAASLAAAAEARLAGAQDTLVRDLPADAAPLALHAAAALAAYTLTFLAISPWARRLTLNSITSLRRRLSNPLQAFT